ncbi:MAG: PadR family transcriptional regulator [Anaerolineae bacterium]|nr:PadR family transcriptional regulator [Anaerolineae bacterium]
MPRTAQPLSLEYVLLGLLDHRPMHGYDLHRELQTRPPLAMIWHVKQGLLYALLDKLESNGCLGHELLAPESGPPRKQYHLTGFGRAALNAWRLSPVADPRDMRQDFLARLYFARLAGSDAARTLLTRQRSTCAGWLEELHARPGPGETPAAGEQDVLTFRLSQARAMLAWVDTLLEEFQP